VGLGFFSAQHIYKHCTARRPLTAVRVPTRGDSSQIVTSLLEVGQNARNSVEESRVRIVYDGFMASRSVAQSMICVWCDAQVALDKSSACLYSQLVSNLFACESRQEHVHVYNECTECVAAHLHVYAKLFMERKCLA
jgi:hypothetical protein